MDHETALKIYRALCQIETGIHALLVLLDKEHQISAESKPKPVDMKLVDQFPVKQPRERT